MGTSNDAITDVARKLAEAHRKADPETLAIYLSRDPEEIRLVEVSNEILTTWAVLPIGFDADPDEDIPYPSKIVLLSPEEWDEVNRGKLPLPESWDTDLIRLDQAG